MIRCDNDGCNGILAAKSTADPCLMRCVRWLCDYLFHRHARYHVLYINTHDNVLADALSRHNVQLFRTQLRRLNLSADATPIDIVWPDIEAL